MTDDIQDLHSVRIQDLHSVRISEPCLLVPAGKGSEMIIDVAPGVDWTMILGSMMLVQQVRHSELLRVYRVRMSLRTMSMTLGSL
jgi:hypothetical protein